jgi:urease accessory protein
MVGGDRLSLQIAAEAHTHALVTTAAAHKVYRSRGPVARQTTQLQVATAASLDWLPQETIIFDGAQYHQSIRVELMPGAIWCGWDLVRFGRSARGEAFLTGHWRTATEVWRQGAPLWIDRQWLAGGSEGLYSRHGLAGYPVIASFVMIGAEITADHIDMARSLWPMAPGDAGVTRLLAGLLCRYRGPSTQQARAWFTQVWQTLKPQLAQVSAQPSRVWG